MRRGLIVISLLFSLVLAGGAQALDIIYPADGTSFSRSNYLILKGGREDITGMTVAINGAQSGLIDISSPQYKQYFKDFLILQPQFQPGRNKVEVSAYVGQDAVSTTDAEVYYINGDPSAIPPDGYRPFVMHIPEREKLCAPCHTMNPDQVQQKLTSEESNPCAACHKKMIDKKYVHGPAGVYDCLYCHEDKPTETGRYPLRATGASLCNECHEEIIEAFSTNEYVHGPVGAGLCNLCHDSHATDFRAQLLTPVNDLCLGCHESVGKSEVHVVRGVGGSGHPLSGVPDPSRPGLEMSCVSCHEPHGGKSGQLFRNGISSRFTLCGLCHKK